MESSLAERKVPSSFCTRSISASEIIAELPKLNHPERREIARRLLKLESDAEILADVNRRADENFLTLEALEAEMPATKPGEIWMADLGLQPRSALVLFRAISRRTTSSRSW